MRRTTALTTLVAMLASLLLIGAAPPQHAGTELTRVIVTFDDNVRGVPAAEAVAASHGVDLAFVYQQVLDGFAGRVPVGRLTALANDPRVASVVPDVEASIAVQTLPTGIRRINADANTSIPTDGSGGRVDADVAVLDTGIDAAHPDLDVVVSVDCMSSHSGGPPSQRTYTCVDGGTDGHGHGTHVAGTIAALDNGAGVVGVAPGARLWSVKVLDDRGSGSASTVIAGLDYVAAANSDGSTVDVANLSLGFSVTVETVDSAIDKLSDTGTAVVVAAGNDAEPAGNSTPGSADSAIVVAALADYDGEAGANSPTCTSFGCDDVFATFSNYGKAVDLIAPGVRILSTFPGGGTWTMSGTSMASPHVAGAAAVLASSGTPGSDVLGVLQATATNDWEWETSPDAAVSEPPHYSLLDVGDPLTFAPEMQGDEPIGDEPEPDKVTVAVTAPLDVVVVSGDSVRLEAETTGTVASVTFAVGDVSPLEGTSNGSGVWEATWDSTAVVDGGYSITATAIDPGGSETISAAITVTVENSPGDSSTLGCTMGGDYCVSALTGTAESLPRGQWRAGVDVTVVDGNGGAASNITVAIGYTTLRGSASDLSCTTGPTGTCTATLDLPNRDSEVTFSIQQLGDSKVYLMPSVTVVR